MYLYLLDKQNKQKNMITSKQRKKKVNVRFDMTKSYGIGRYTVTNINICGLLFLFIFQFFFSKSSDIEVKGKNKSFTVHSIFLPNMSCIFPSRSLYFNH